MIGGNTIVVQKDKKQDDKEQNSINCFARYKNYHHANKYLDGESKNLCLFSQSLSQGPRSAKRQV